ncbi:MAG: 3-oxoacyl-[acyl-carrier-protein] synthase III C-terminal domain-containing protein, partial [Muribaculaceae bacterium]|nr:3-oxoacyl-[acyl-carrier-protein] synthase III C-terminal domain-containing protein [Muribaculaceae bacterium]
YKHKLKKGDKVILTAFGAGFTWGAMYLIWG